MRKLYWTCVAVCGLIGVAPTGFTFIAFDQLSQGALYFAGTGIGTLVLALFNAAVWSASSPAPWSRRLLNVANALMMVFGFFAIRAVPEPQAFVGLLGWSDCSGQG